MFKAFKSQLFSIIDDRMDSEEGVNGFFNFLSWVTGSILNSTHWDSEEQIYREKVPISLMAKEGAYEKKGRKKLNWVRLGSLNQNIQKGVKSD